MDKNKETLVLIDGNSLLNRAFYATPVFMTRDGVPTNGILGFIKLMLKIIKDIKPEYMVVTFDLHAPTFRHLMYDGYKAGRKKMPDELRVQVPILKECLSAMKICICEKEGFEADDLIGTLSKKFNVHSIIYTGDRDSYQLVSETTDVYYTKRGVSDILHLTVKNFTEITELIPRQIIDLKSLMGDKSDNIPGVTGVGEKSAMELIKTYDNLDNIYSHIDEIKGALNKKLNACKEQAFMSKTLATIKVDVPLDMSLADCTVPNKFSAEVRQKFVELEFKTLLSMDIFDDVTDDKKTESITDEKIEIKIFSEDEDLNEFYESLDGADIISADFEKELRLYFYNTEYVFPVKENFFDVGFMADSLSELLKRVFSNSDRKLIVYKSKELRHKLSLFSVDFIAETEDVSLMKYLVEYTGKDEELEFILDYYRLAQDKKAYGLYKVYQIYKDKISEENALHLYRDIERPLSKILYDMENNGVCIAEDKIPAFEKKYNDELSELSKEIYSLAGETFNINSPSQLGVVLFEKLNLENGKKGKNGRYSTNVEVLEKLAPDNEIVRLVLRYRQIQKLKSTYIDGIKTLILNGKIHTTYNQTITATGRLSSINPNIQNIPVRNSEGRELRKLFVASEGNILIDADYSQIELRLLAHFSGCKELIEAYNNDEDIHSLTASQVFNVPIENVTPEMRRNAKAVNFGIIYGISSFGLAKDLNISVSNAQNYINKYFESYSDVKEYMEENVAKAKQHGYITTFTGRKRVINELKSSNYNVRSFGERAAMNMPLQGSSADIIKIAMINVYNRLKNEGLKAKLILQVHDELVIDCPLNEKEEVAEILKYEMENAVKLLVPLTVEVNFGQNWFEAK